MSLSAFFSSFVSTIHADSPAEEKPEETVEAESAEEEEEEEPEDPLPELQEECKGGKCAEAAKHFAHCEEKVNSGQGFQHEDCVEEFYHMMHCVDACVAPKLFAKLK